LGFLPHIPRAIMDWRYYFCDMWSIKKITHGTEQNQYHWHSYYDLPVFNAASQLVVAQRVNFANRRPVPEDKIEIGIIDVRQMDSWEKIGESRAWSWQQGAMAQWVANTNTIIWNDRVDNQFIARRHNIVTGQQTIIPYPIYAVTADGSVGLSLNFSRLNGMRPGYGYAGISDASALQRRPADDGIWRVDLSTGVAKLIASIADLYTTIPLWQRLPLAAHRYFYWVNHLKFSPDGTRFTVKYRFRVLNRSWREQQSFSLTGESTTGRCQYLVDAASHVLWKNSSQLYLWRKDGFYLYQDGGRRLQPIAPLEVKTNSHLQYMPASPNQFIYDQPYQKEIPLYQYDETTGHRELIARFKNHQPAKGEFRCDLHPTFSSDGRRIIVSSLQDGGRQLYLLERN